MSLDQVRSGLSGATTYEDLPQWARRRLAIILGPLLTPEMRTLAAPDLPVLERVANRILAALPPGANSSTPTLYRPPRMVEPLRYSRPNNFVLHEGRIVPEALLIGERLDVYDVQLVAVSSASPAFQVVHSFSSERPAPAGLAGALLPVAAEAPEKWTPQLFDIRMRLDGSACRAWNAAPREKGGAYFKVHSQVSMAIQTALRRWVAWRWFSRISQFGDTANAFTALAYLCAHPYPGRRRTDFSFDVMSNDWMDYAFRCSRRPLKTALRGVRQALLAAGEDELAHVYHPDSAPNILKRVRKERKSIRAVVAAEGAIVNHILKFGIQLQAAEPIVAAHAAPDFVKGLGTRLRKLFREEDLTFLGRMLLLEATNALHQAMGGESALNISVTTRPDPAADPVPVAILPAPPQSHPEPLPC